MLYNLIGFCKSCRERVAEHAGRFASDDANESERKVKRPVMHFNADLTSGGTEGGVKSRLWQASGLQPPFDAAE